MERYLPTVNKEVIEPVLAAKDLTKLYEILVEPLHEELYKRQDFAFFDDLSVGQQLLLSYDYIRMQVMQGGFIQLIQNGYIPLLVDMPEWLQTIGDDTMAKVIDDALKVYVLNREMLDKKTSVEEFAQLYDELQEFEYIDARFREDDPAAVQRMMEYAAENIGEFVKVE